MLLQKRIHDWSKTLPAWQSDLLRRLAGGALTDGDRTELRGILTGQAGAPAPVPLELVDLPVDEDEHGRVELRSVGDFQNINCLAEKQTLHLQPGLNVVFGVNGSGKTGHGRLLRGVCRAAEREEVLPNVFEAATRGPQTATVRIAVDGAERSIAVDLAKRPDRVLSAVSVFDARCARVFLTKPNVVDYVPRSLVILKMLAEEQDAIADGLRSEATQLRVGLPKLPALPEESAAAAALEALGPKTDFDKLERLANLSDAEENELERLETAAATIRADMSGELEKAAHSRASGASAAVVAIREAAALVNTGVFSKIADVREQLAAIATAEHDLAGKAFADSRFPGAGSDPWLEMWWAIVRYVEAGGGAFPSSEPGAVCPTCEQELTPVAAARLADAQRFVRGELRQRAEALERELQDLLAALPNADTLKLRVMSDLRDAPEVVAEAGAAAVSLIASRAEYARGGTSGEPEPASFNEVDVVSIEAYASAQCDAAGAQAALRAAETQQELLRALAELRARRTLREHLPAVKQRIDTLVRIAVLDDAVDKLGTKPISLQLRKLQEAEITERLRSAIQEELEYATSLSAKVEIVGQASKGETRIQLRLTGAGKHTVDSVLSTGEQAALGTTFFLAELAVSADESAIVLEDPVSSLDHDHREHLARRLVEEAKKRQVVIYTHDLSFLVYLQDAAVQEDIELHGHTLVSSLDEAGIVREGLPTKLMSPADRRKDLRRRLRFELKPMFKGKKPEYERAADLWVVDLRKAYDQVIEDYVLAGTVRRFNRHVRVRQLFMVKWTPEIASRIEAAMKTASPKTHHEAPELYPRPYTPDELEAMLVEFEEIADRTSPKNGKAAAGSGDVEQERGQTTLDDELVAKVSTLPQAS